MTRLNLTGYKTDQTSKSEIAMKTIFILIIHLLSLKEEQKDFEFQQTSIILSVLIYFEMVCFDPKYNVESMLFIFNVV